MRVVAQCEEACEERLQQRRWEDSCADVCVWQEILCVCVCVGVCASFSISKGVLFIFFIFPFSFFSLHFRIQCYLSASSSSSPSSAFAASLLLCLCNPSSVSQCAFVVNFFVVFASLFSTFFLHSCVSVYARCVCATCHVINSTSRRMSRTATTFAT